MNLRSFFAGLLSSSVQEQEDKTYIYGALEAGVGDQKLFLRVEKQKPQGEHAHESLLKPENWDTVCVEVWDFESGIWTVDNGLEESMQSLNFDILTDEKTCLRVLREYGEAHPSFKKPEQEP